MTGPQASASHPLVSVVVPVHNGERYLAECLASVFAQTWRPLEVIVVDDGSTDGSAAVAATAGPVRILSQANAGVATARNAGVAAAQADFIALLDQDDLWLPAKLAVQMQHLLDDPALDYVLTGQERFIEPGCTLPAWARPHQVDTVVGGCEPSAVLFRRAAFERVGPFDPRFIVASDADWFFRATDAGLRMLLLPDALLRRRLHGENNSRFTDLGNRELRQVVMESVRRKRASAAQGRTA
jgi:glycosyltransferase involved in cell wall biosynthesis